MSSWLGYQTARVVSDLVAGEVQDEASRDWAEVHPDERIRQELVARLHGDESLMDGDLELRVIAGVVTLLGSVPVETMKQRAEEVCAAMPGIFSVDNKLRVASSGAGK